MSSNPPSLDNANQRPFRRAVFRGLAVVTPPLLTIVIFVWIWNTILDYVLVPVETIAREVITAQLSSEMILDEIPSDAEEKQFTEEGELSTFKFNDAVFVPTNNGQWIQQSIYAMVENDKRSVVPDTATEILKRYIDIRYLNRYIVIPFFLSVFIILLYLLGKFLAAGIGRFVFSFFEQLIHRLPIIRNVYGSVKQVSDFILSEREIEYTRVVAVEYPRKGVWSIGFVTGESFLDIRCAANEPVVSVLMPTSPMPATGFTITIRKSETIDVNITVDQAFQFCLSCGVVIPSSQQVVEEEVKAMIQGAVSKESNPIANGSEEE